MQCARKRNARDFLFQRCNPLLPVDNVWAMITVWSIRGKIIKPLSHLWQSRKCDRACRTLRHGASHSRATRFRNRTLLCSTRLWRTSESRVKDESQSRRCDIGLRTVLCCILYFAQWCDAYMTSS